MSEQTPQEEMSDRLSKMARKRSGRLVKPSVSDLIKARNARLAGEESRKDKMASLRAIIGKDSGGKGPETMAQQRRADRSKTASERAPQKHPYARSNK